MVTGALPEPGTVNCVIEHHLTGVRRSAGLLEEAQSLLNAGVGTHDLLGCDDLVTEHRRLAMLLGQQPVDPHTIADSVRDIEHSVTWSLQGIMHCPDIGAFLDERTRRALDCLCAPITGPARRTGTAGERIPAALDALAQLNEPLVAISRRMGPRLDSDRVWFGSWSRMCAGRLRRAREAVLSILSDPSMTPEDAGRVLSDLLPERGGETMPQPADDPMGSAALRLPSGGVYADSSVLLIGKVALGFEEVREAAIDAVRTVSETGPAALESSTGRLDRAVKHHCSIILPAGEAVERTSDGHGAACVCRL